MKKNVFKIIGMEAQRKMKEPLYRYFLTKPLNL